MKLNYGSHQNFVEGKLEVGFIFKFIEFYIENHFFFEQI